MPVTKDHDVVPSSDLLPAVTEQDSIGSASTTQKVFEQLRARIIQGEIAPGERLKVESLKVLLNTGASPIREALSLLTS